MNHPLIINDIDSSKIPVKPSKVNTKNKINQNQ